MAVGYEVHGCYYDRRRLRMGIDPAVKNPWRTVLLQTAPTQYVAVTAQVWIKTYHRDSARRRSLRRSRSFKATNVRTSQKPVCDFLSVNNTNLHRTSYFTGQIIAGFNICNE